jgi:hypothetical protein
VRTRTVGLTHALGQLQSTTPPVHGATRKHTSLAHSTSIGTYDSTTLPPHHYSVSERINHLTSSLGSKCDGLCG